MKTYMVEVKDTLEEQMLMETLLKVAPVPVKRKLKTVKDLAGCIITDVHVSKSNAVALTVGNQTIVITDGTVKSDLGAEDLLALGLVSKNDLDNYKRLRALGLT